MEDITLYFAESFLPVSHNNSVLKESCILHPVQEVMAKQISFSLQPVHFVDVPIINRIGKDSFVEDRHTQVKKLGKATISYLDDDSAGYRLAQSLKIPKQVFIKAVDDKTGEILGSSTFFFRNFDLKDIPKDGLGEEPGFPKPKDIEKNDNGQELLTEADKAIAKLEEMESKDMEYWENVLMPPDSKCLIIMGVSVDPKHQRKGIGAALLKWGTDQADKHGVFMWVHSSEMAWEAYANAGFEVAGTLDVDLDSWAPAPPPKEEGEGSIWGHYVIRYMKRPARPL
jgi:GNAT superfamily N-acetyltransferase